MREVREAASLNHWHVKVDKPAVAVRDVDEAGRRGCEDAEVS